MSDQWIAPWETTEEQEQQQVKSNAEPKRKYAHQADIYKLYKYLDGHKSLFDGTSKKWTVLKQEINDDLGISVSDYTLKEAFRYFGIKKKRAITSPPAKPPAPYAKKPNRIHISERVAQLERGLQFLMDEFDIDWQPFQPPEPTPESAGL